MEITILKVNKLETLLSETNLRQAYRAENKKKLVSSLITPAIMLLMDKVKTIRLDKFLANAGVVSRRSIKKLLKDYEVTVNGKRATESGTRINPHDDVRINNEKVQKSELVYYLLNKPMGIISTTADEIGRDNVVSLIDTIERIYPVGRLDKDTHGLMLLTNDGELTHKLIHPKYHVPKTYKLIIEGTISNAQVKALRTGVLLDDGITLPAEVEIKDQQNEKTIIEMTIHEGKNRQIRRMCLAVGLELLDLQRIAIGPLTLGKLKSGENRELTKKEIESLKKATKNAESKA